jgi:tetratricopeptide (TPR) repeat protein
VRFNPADLTTWGWWVTGLEQVAQLQFERGDVSGSLATYQSIMALKDDRRAPSSLGPIVWVRWLPIAALQAQLGDKAAAEAAVKGLVHDLNEAVAQLAPEDRRRALFAQSEQGLRGRVALLEGDSQTALTNATAMLDRTDKIDVPATDTNANRTKNNMLRAVLGTAALASIRLGKHAQAETFARRLVTVPNDTNNTRADNDLQAARAAATLAHAIVLQGRAEEARALLQPALAYGDSEFKAGAHGSSFRRDYAYALYVSALARPANAEGRLQREADLAEAAKVIGGASAEVQKMSAWREISDWIAAARAHSST